MMKTEIKESGNQLIVTLCGQLDTLASQETEKALEPVYVSGKKDVVLDCTDLEYIASSGLRLFLSLLKKVKARGGDVTIKNINDDIQNVFKVTGFINLFNFENEE